MVQAGGSARPHVLQIFSAVRYRPCACAISHSIQPIAIERIRGLFIHTFFLVIYGTPTHTHVCHLENFFPGYGCRLQKKISRPGICIGPTVNLTREPTKPSSR